MTDVAEYLRFAALGDSTTVGLGDRTADGWRGWSRLLVAALDAHHAVSYLNVAEVGATARLVRDGQLQPALSHHPQLASLVVGVNDTMRSGWCPAEQRADLLACGRALSQRGATLLLVRFPDMANLPLPPPLGRVLAARIRQLNATVDELTERFDNVLVDLSCVPGVSDGTWWSVDRLHPSELGHRRLADAFGTALAARGLPVAPVPQLRDGLPDGVLADAHWLLTQATPWLGRRVRDLVPAAVRGSTSRITGTGRVPAAAPGRRQEPSGSDPGRAPTVAHGRVSRR